MLKISALRFLINKTNENLESLNIKEIKEALAFALLELINELKVSTEFRSKKVLKCVSMLQTDEIFSKMLTPYLANQKHYKRRYSKEIIKCITNISKALGNIEVADNNSLLDKILHRSR